MVERYILLIITTNLVFCIKFIQNLNILTNAVLMKQCSIDSLLDRTIRYMIFLQSITRYADKLQEPSEPKVIDQRALPSLDKKYKTLSILILFISSPSSSCLYV